jgi:alpha-L-fucosidase 2
MKYFSIFILIVCLLPQFSCNCKPDSEKELDPSLVLWYDKPAENWTEALPVGNGRLGAMIYGGTEKEIIQFNEETLWSGQPHDYAHKGASEVFHKMRQLLWDGKQIEAQDLGNERFMSTPFGQFSFLPFGNILLDFPGHENAANYTRKLDLEDAITSVVYEVGEVKYKREVISSEPDQVLMVHLEASKKGELNFTAGLDSPQSIYEVSVEGDQIILRGKANDYQNEAGRAGFTFPKS